jgi:hypothetical protein
MSLLVGVVLCAFALVASIVPALVSDLARDTVFARALGVTTGMAGFILARVSLQAASGPRRILGLVIAAPLIALAVLLLVSPASATWLHDTGRTVFVPWVFGIPAVMALLLSRWRVR